MTGISSNTDNKLVEFRKDGKVAWLDLVDGKLAFSGDLEPTEAAQLFMDELGHLIDQRIAALTK